jgi:hypothetical protein
VELMMPTIRRSGSSDFFPTGREVVNALAKKKENQLHGDLFEQAGQRKLKPAEQQQVDRFQIDCDRLSSLSGSELNTLMEQMRRAVGLAILSPNRNPAVLHAYYDVLHTPISNFFSKAGVVIAAPFVIAGKIFWTGSKDNWGTLSTTNWVSDTFKTHRFMEEQAARISGYFEREPAKG